MLSETRLRMEAEQNEFVKALFGVESAPAEFDSERFQQASLILKNKRMKGVKKSWPKLINKLGSDFKYYFDEYTCQTSQPRYQASLLDGRLFAQFLERRNLLPAEVVPEVKNFDSSYIIKKKRLYRRDKIHRTFYRMLKRFGERR